MRFFEQESQAAIYAKSRPIPPNSIIQHLLKLIPPDKRLLCVDVGCGSGQFTFPLSPHFKSTIGIDVSEPQINQARKREKENDVQFLVGDENMTDHIKNEVIIQKVFP